MLNLDRTLDRPGATLRFTVLDGHRRTVVLVHGAGMDHSMFAAQALALHETGHSIVVFDQRGHGVSHLEPGRHFTGPAALDDLAALLDHLALDRPALVGHSLGGNVAQALVRRDPARAGALIAIDSTWNTGPLSRGERAALHLAAPALSLIPASRLPGMLARASAVTPRAIALTEAVFARMPKRAFLDVWRATVSFVEPDAGYRVPIPLGLIRGELDRTGNIATAMPAWAGAEGIRERVVAGAGHVVTLDAPEATTTALHELLASVPHA
ncbi:alpha/beta fold hydrolase [Agromyces cerinus]|uniref:Pimeloyl-ACP methyl ester carboxylesterase n=1 Tax=Agromyces cerinus subsp. cerinus TaxID=232089 RepID=A0A1N6HIN6_9MICO|nr:alpha/beta hydrolase [Agromyces cerinus]SIO19661.1 Pimeloyl-ACP methyl ester carboxylesterase [Agromyces cerinus subsp. cerinus]